MASLNYIITAKHYCIKDRVATVTERIKKLQRDIQQKTNATFYLDVTSVTGRPVYARIEMGQWIADCECGGAEFVDPDEPIFACMSCGNRIDSGKMRPVIFPAPETRKEVERLVLERPVDDVRGQDDLQRAYKARPLIVLEQPDGRLVGLTRSWNPHETVEDLHRENEPVRRMRIEKIKGKGT